MSSDTQSNNKRIAKNTMMLYMRMLFILVVSLYTSRVTLQYLGVQDFGIYNVVAGVVTMMNLFNSAMSVSTTRYLTFELGKGDYIRLKQVFSTCFSIYVLLSAVFLVLAETVGLWFVNYKLVIPADRMVAANWIYQFSIISCVNTIMANPYNAVLVAHEKMNVYAYISILEAILKLVIVYILVVTPYDRLIVYGGLYMLTSLCIRMLYRRYCVKNYEESKYELYWEKPLFVQLLSYSWWNLFGAASGIAKGQGLNMLLNMFFSPVVNAARGIAYQINTNITLFFTNFYTAVRPQITKYYAQGNWEEMFKLIFRSSKFSFYLIFLPSLPIIIETPSIVSLWLGQLPDYVVPFTRLIVLISAVDSMATPLMTACHATGRISLYQSSVGTLIMLNVPISYIFLRFFDATPEAVFVISLFISVVALFLRVGIVKRLIPEFPTWNYINEVFLKSLFVIMVAAVVPLVLHYFLSSSLVYCLVNILVCVISYIVTIYLIGLKQGERQAIVSLVNKKLHRK